MGDIHQSLCQHVDDAGFLHTADDDKQTDEEHNGRPFDVGNDVLCVLLADNQHDSSGGQRNNTGLNTQRAVHDETDDNQSDEHEALYHQSMILDGLALVQLHNQLGLFCVDTQLLAVHYTETYEHDCENYDNNQTGVLNKVYEGQTCRRTDHDVRRVTDQGGSTADVGRHDLGHQERNRIDLQNLRDGNGHRADQQDGGDVVQKGGKNRGDDDKQHHDAPRITLRDFGGFDCNEFKYAGIFYHCNEQHHTDQDTDRVKVDIADGGVYVQNADQEQEDGASGCSDCTMNLFGHDGDDDSEKDDNGSNLWCSHKKTSLLFAFCIIWKMEFYSFSFCQNALYAPVRRIATALCKKCVKIRVKKLFTLTQRAQFAQKNSVIKTNKKSVLPRDGKSDFYHMSSLV